MSHFFIIADQDLLSIDIQRGREIGVPTYNNIREKCGFPRASSFDDLSNILSKSVSLLSFFEKSMEYNYEF